MKKINNVHKIIGYLEHIADLGNEDIKKRISKEIIPTIVLLSIDAKYQKSIKKDERRIEDV